MEVSSTTSEFTSSAVKASDKAQRSVNTDYETFLKMMTTQLKNQDPLNPINSADYAVQLATFSSVEQQTRTNQLLEGLTSQFSMQGLGQMASWVGNQVRAVMPVYVDGGPVSLSPAPSADSDRAVVVVKDATGSVVNRFDIARTTTAMDWIPVDISGAALAPGQYSFSLESYKDETLLNTSDVEVYASIAEVRNGASGVTLIMAGGIEIPASGVTALRQ